MSQNALPISYNTRRANIAPLFSIDDITLSDVSSSESDNTLSDENGSNDSTRPAAATSSPLKIVVIENTRDSLAERELFIISLSAIVNINKNLLILANIELLLARKLENAKETSLANNTSLDINSLDLVISSHSILTIER